MMQESSLNRAPAQRPIVIEVSGEPQGVVVPAEGGYRFVAVKLPAFAIDGQHFPSVDLAYGITRTSRLGCQLIMTEALDGLVVKLPAGTRNAGG